MLLNAHLLPEGNERARALVALLPYLPAPDQVSVVNRVQEMPLSGHNLHVIYLELARHAPRFELREVIGDTWRIRDESARAGMLVTLAREMHEELQEAREQEIAAMQADTAAQNSSSETGGDKG